MLRLKKLKVEAKQIPKENVLEQHPNIYIYIYIYFFYFCIYIFVWYMCWLFILFMYLCICVDCLFVWLLSIYI